MPKNKLNAKTLRQKIPSKKEINQINRQPVYLILDNILDTFNIGSFFRLADAIAAEKIYLCGKMVTPPNPKIHRASIGTWRWVPWEHHSSTINLIKKLKKDKVFTVAAELNPKSIDYKKLKINTPIALVIGHESRGVAPEILKEVDQIVKIPMLGINKSLNVLVSASVILYDWISKI